MVIISTMLVATIIQAVSAPSILLGLGEGGRRAEHRRRDRRRQARSARPDFPVMKIPPVDC